MQSGNLPNFRVLIAFSDGLEYFTIQITHFKQIFMKQIWFWLAAFVVGLGACKTGKVTYAPDKIVPTEKSVFWKISGNGLKKPSYLYGTIHLIPKDDFKLPVVVVDALEDSKRVAFEIDMKEMTNFRTQMSLITKSFMAGGKTLKDLLSPEDYALVKAKMEEKGLPGGMFERMKPMFLSTLFSSDEDGGTANGGNMTSVEMELFRASKRQQLESTGLETAAYQMSIFDSIPYEAQAKMLVDGLRDTGSGNPDGESELDTMLKLYRDQDITGMQSMISDVQYGMSKYEEILLNQRNRNWIPVMNRLMKEKPTIFAVGAGHLGGTGGVVALLRKEGYKVEVVQ